MTGKVAWRIGEKRNGTGARAGQTAVRNARSLEKQGKAHYLCNDSRGRRATLLGREGLAAAGAPRGVAVFHAVAPAAPAICPPVMAPDSASPPPPHLPQTVHIHPSSGLSEVMPRWLVYHELGGWQLPGTWGWRLCFARGAGSRCSRGCCCNRILVLLCWRPLLVAFLRCCLLVDALP